MDISIEELIRIGKQVDQSWRIVVEQMLEKFGDDWKHNGTMDMLRQFEYPNGLPDLTREWPVGDGILEPYKEDPNCEKIAKLGFNSDDGGPVWRPMWRMGNGLWFGVAGKWVYNEDTGECLCFD